MYIVEMDEISTCVFTTFMQLFSTLYDIGWVEFSKMGGCNSWWSTQNQSEYKHIAPDCEL